MTKRNGLVKQFKRFRWYMTSLLFDEGVLERPKSNSNARFPALRGLKPSAAAESQQGIGYLTAKSRYEHYKRLAKLQRSRTSKDLLDKSRIEHLITWLRGEQRQHFGPKAQIADLFERRDSTYLALASQRLRWQLPAPRNYHDFIDAAVKVAKIERIIGYEFKDRMLCIEALKATSEHVPLYFEGMIRKVAPNNRLALLGDRLLSMVVCDIWYRSGRPRKEISSMERHTVTRVALAVKGRNLGFDKSILKPSNISEPSRNHIAETFEAILGAIYIDSGYQLSSVIKVSEKIVLVDHWLLRTPGVQGQVEIQRQDHDNFKNISLDEVTPQAGKT